MCVVIGFGLTVIICFGALATFGYSSLFGFFGSRRSRRKIRNPKGGIICTDIIIYYYQGVVDTC